MAATILVLSGNSAVGSETVRQLVAQGVAVRGGVRDTSKAASLSRIGAEVVHADLARPDTLDAALNGIRHVLLSTGADPEIAAVHAGLYGPARAAGVDHVVRISVVGADVRSKVLLGRAHGTADQNLKSSGLGWTAPSALLYAKPASQRGDDFARCKAVSLHG
jgi:uncharacterized protein YbjT (DUF2867 family)